MPIENNREFYPISGFSALGEEVITEILKIQNRCLILDYLQ
jgi:hypothetical protein